MSGFDPIRREVARLTLEQLILDGRIHPGRIEEVVGKCRKEVARQTKQAGEQAVMELEIDNINTEMVHMLGRLKYRTSYTQNVLELGVDVANRFNEHKYVVNAIGAHHEDIEPESLYAVLVIAGDTISASRPGARREMLETYVKRMTKLEEIGDSFKGVEKTYAIQAGREVRIVVVPDIATDEESNILAKNVARRIEKEVTYPGEVKITVIRETRFTEVAH